MVVGISPYFYAFSNEKHPKPEIQKGVSNSQVFLKKD